MPDLRFEQVEVVLNRAVRNLVQIRQEGARLSGLLKMCEAARSQISSPSLIVLDARLRRNLSRLSSSLACWEDAVEEIRSEVRLGKLRRRGSA